MSRQFKLINVRGEERDLLRRDALFFNVSGLGLSRTIKTIQAGQDFIEIDDNLNQQTVSGDMYFADYAQYRAFTRFCAHEPLTLCYKPNTTVWYYRTCRLAKIDKSGKTLVCPVDFLCLSVWQENISVAQTEPVEGAGKVYDVSTYDYIYIETSAGTLQISNLSDLPSPCRLHIMGPIASPEWSLMQGGNVIASGKVDATIPAGNKLVVDSSPRLLEIAERVAETDAFVQNRYANSDFSTIRFLMIPPGESQITFSHAGAGEMTAYVEVMQLAATV